MTPDVKRVYAEAARLARTPGARKAYLWLAGIVAFIAVAGFLVAPPLVKGKLEEVLTAGLHRKTTIERIDINPFTLAVTVQGLLVRERDSEEHALRFDELHADASITSLFRLAPVFYQMRLVKPQIRLVRNEDGSYNYQDLIDEFLSRPAGPTPRFSLNNIEVIDGRIDVDDRPEKQQHQVTELKIGIPFLSSLPYATAVKVQPALAGKFDGAPFSVTGQTTPFDDTRQTSLDVNLDGLELARFLEYAPVTLNFKLAGGHLHTRLKLVFVMGGKEPRTLTVAGGVRFEDVDVREVAGPPLVALRSLAAEIESIDVLNMEARIASVEVDGVEAHVKRSKDSVFNVRALIAGRPKARAGGEREAKDRPVLRAAQAVKFALGELNVANGKVHVEDHVPSTPVRIVIDDLKVAMRGLSNAAEAKATGSASFRSNRVDSCEWEGSVQFEPKRADGKLVVTGVRLNAFLPYYSDVLNVEMPQGTLDLAASFTASLDGDTLGLQVSDLGATIKSLQVRLPGEKDTLARVGTFEIKDAAADLVKRTLTVGEIVSRDGAARVVRESDGRINLTRALAVPPAAPDAATKAPVPDAGSKAPPAPWNISIKRVALDRFAADYQDLTQKTPIMSRLSAIAVNVENLSNAKGAKSLLRVQANVNEAGKLALAGPVVLDPLALDLRVDITGLDLMPAQPLVAERLNVAMTSGALSAKGALKIELPPGAPARASYKGDLTVADFASVDRLMVEDFLKWKSLYLGGIDATLEPLQVGVAEIALADFYSRLIVNADATLNVQHVVKKPDAPVQQVGGTASELAAKPAAPAPPAQERPAALPPNVSIGKVTVQNGTVNFTDLFIKPNYSADISGLTGSVGRMAADTPGEVELRGQVQKSAPLTITGRVNPFARDLFVDIRAEAKDVELPPLTPYAAKYAGYGIEKGKLSMDVKYHLENRKLDAENRIYLDQLTFGEKVDSPTATKLPVLLAVALLKDRNGVIDINLPISGTLDDPQFSLGGIIVQVIVNLFVKVITSPFALLGSIFGGGEELAYLEFAPGSAALTAASAKKLESVAKALNDRPALKMEIAGRVDPGVDREGLRQASLERKVKAQKVKALLASGGTAPSLDQIKVEPGEYEKYLTAAYGEEKFPKPRNVIGLAKGLPVPEMEKLMLTHAEVGDEDLRRLAEQRAGAAKDWLLGEGKIPAERVFLLAPRLSAEGVKDKGKPTRVDFSLK